METCSKKERRLLYALMLIFVIFSGGIITAGYFYYKNYGKEYRARVEQQLSAIGKLKADELVNWRHERLGDAGIFYKNGAFSSLVQRYFEKPEDTKVQARLRMWMDKILSHAHYDRVSLLDAKGIERMSVPVGMEPIASIMSKNASGVLQLGRMSFTDFYRNEYNQKIYLNILVPILAGPDDSVGVGVLVLRIDPEQYLYPVINSWPIPSLTAETLLIRRCGDDVLFLNELRFKKDTALTLQSSLKNEQMPVVKAVLGHKGIVDGIGYNIVPVIADIRAIPNSPWFIVSRVDTSEVYAPIRERLWVSIIFVGILLTGTSAGVGLIWRQQNARYYKEKYESTREWGVTFDSVRDLVSTVGVDFKLKRVNKAFADTFKKCPEELVGRYCYEVMHRSSEPYRDCPFKKSLHTKEAATTEYFDASLGKYFGVSASPILDDKGEITEVVQIVHDITEYKKAEKALRQSEDKYRSIINSTADGYWYVDSEGRFLEVNAAACKMLGYREDELLKMKVSDVEAQEKPEDVMRHIQKMRELGGDRFETVHRCKDGRLIEVEVCTNFIKDADGLERISAFIRDITERKTGGGIFDSGQAAACDTKIHVCNSSIKNNL